MIAAEALFALLAAITPVERGRVIYERGDAAIRAEIGGETIETSLLACASCHGLDGRGRAEGGEVPSDIRSATLTRPYEVSAPSGRKHGPYDERALLRAISMGVDPAGNALSEVMPRYQLTRDDARALIAFMKTLGTRSDPGVAEDAITIGVLGDAVPQFEGEVFGRRVEFRAAAALTEDAFAYIADSADAALAAEADRLGVPVISLLSPEPVSARNVFHLFGGIAEQRRVLSQVEGDRVRVPASLATADVFRQKATVAFVMLPSSRTPRAQAALAAQALVVDALRRAGREVTRAGFVAALESTSQLQTGHAPPLTFSATRRIGSTGAYLVEFDEGKASAPRWVD